MEVRKNLEQAKHNERVCNFLSRNKEHSDWVITIAFYSAIHFVRHLMLPFVDRGTTYTDFEPLFRSKKRKGEGRHGFQSRFVEENYEEIKYEFVKLHDMSENARYMNYKYQRVDADNAKKYLQEIRQYTINKEKAAP